MEFLYETPLKRWKKKKIFFFFISFNTSKLKFVLNSRLFIYASRLNPRTKKFISFCTIFSELSTHKTCEEKKKIFLSKYLHKKDKENGRSVVKDFAKFSSVDIVEWHQKKPRFELKSPKSLV